MNGVDVAARPSSKPTTAREYVQQVRGSIRAKNPAEPEFHQAAQEVFE
jgi:hypothetical protein